jgi:hypothetical protein
LFGFGHILSVARVVVPQHEIGAKASRKAERSERSERYAERTHS